MRDKQAGWLARQLAEPARLAAAASLAGPISPTTARWPADSLAPLPAGQPASFHYAY